MINIGGSGQLFKNFLIQKYGKYRDNEEKLKTKGMLTYRQKTCMKQCHLQILNKLGSKGGFDLSKYTIMRGGNWSNFGMNWFIKDIVCWDIPTFLYLNFNSEANILKQIQHVLLPNLKQLQLRGNNIQTLEPLSNIYAPMLQKLNLGQSNVINYQPLRRMNTMNLKVLTIKLNNIYNVQVISELLASKNFEVAVTDPYYSKTLILPNTYIHTKSAKFISQTNRCLCTEHQTQKKQKKLDRTMIQPFDNYIMYSDKLKKFDIIDLKQNQ